jgi:hypothetical protein
VAAVVTVGAAIIEDEVAAGNLLDHGEVLKILSQPVNPEGETLTTRNRPLEHQIFWQHHVFGCNSWFYSNQRINALRYLGVMATKNVGCVC